jgi:hypothetical protein
LLAAQLDKAVSLGSDAKKSAEDKKRKSGGGKKRVDDSVSPADHLALQSLRSSALARKTNTTAKFSRDCRNLYADLMLGDGGADAEKKTEEKKEAIGNEVRLGNQFQMKWGYWHWHRQRSRRASCSSSQTKISSSRRRSSRSRPTRQKLRKRRRRRPS